MNLEEKRNKLIRLYTTLKNPPKDIKADLKEMRKDTLKNEVRAIAKQEQISLEIAEITYGKALDSAIAECLYITCD